MYPTVRVDEATHLEDGFEQLKEARHAAMYYGFGIDDWSFDQMANRESGRTNIAAKGNNYKQFAYGILQDVLNGTTDLFAHIQEKCSREFDELLAQICSMIYYPPFDLRKDLADQTADALQETPGCRLWISTILAQAS